MNSLPATIDDDTVSGREFVLDLAGQLTSVRVTETQLREIHLPLLAEFADRADGCGGRVIVFLAGPPGSGKSTMAGMWQVLAAEDPVNVSVQALPMDGFHLPNAVLDVHTTVRDGREIPLRQIKGAPETFDLAGIRTALNVLRTGEPLTWPAYDRKLHDPVPDAIAMLTDGVFVVEGNYLLLDEPGWRELRQFADVTVFIEADEEELRHDLLNRYCRGGRSRAEAIAHYEFSDRRNFQRMMTRQQHADIRLRTSADRKFVRDPE